jgi:hypothetical protein
MLQLVSRIEGRDGKDVRVGEALTKSRKSCALASAVVRCLGVILDVV